MTQDDFEVVVVGGGLAGLAAALRCAQRGVKVAVLEQGEAEAYPCNSRMAMGFFTIAGLGMNSAPEALLEAVDRVTAGEADPELASTLARASGPAFDWLRRQGIRFIRFGPPASRRPVLTPLVPLRPGLDWPGRGADVMLRTLSARLLSAGGQLLRGYRAEELLVDGATCKGVVARRGSDAIRFTAEAVVLADGGFQNDIAALGRHVSPFPERLLQRNAGTARGDGLRMAEAAGAAVTELTAFYGHVQSRDAMSNPRLWPYPTADFPVSAGIAVDRDGRRFVDEGLGGLKAANAIARLDDPAGAVAVFDSAIWNGPATTFVIPANPNLSRQGATIHRAESLHRIASLSNLPAEALADTVERYNRAIETGTLQALEPGRTVSLFQAHPIRTPPFYAVPLCAGITYTMGGLAIDARARLRRREGGTFKGLYAAGSTTGGHEGGSRVGYTGGLAKALVFGLMAADDLTGALAGPE